jgi:hypothetical protein
MTLRRSDLFSILVPDFMTAFQTPLPPAGSAGAREIHTFDYARRRDGQQEESGAARKFRQLKRQLR